MSALLQQAIANIHDKRVLVCPLNWGLGHATRCVPIINTLRDNGNQVLLAADGAAKQFLQQEFQCNVITFPGLTVRYSASQSQVGSMLIQLPKFCYQILREHQQLQQLIREHNIDLVISDNRFGLWSEQVPCIYITHQLMIKMPRHLQFLEKIAWKCHQRIIQKYTTCWIPDDPRIKLSGDLAHKYPLPKNGVFIGIISRFSTDAKTTKKSPYQALAMVSGPEPQRSQFEQQLIAQLSQTDEPALLITGQPSAALQTENLKNLTICNHLNTSELEQLILTTPNIICRSGYSTLMDLYTLGRTATLVPTPGQTEQEYLAGYAQKFGFSTKSQTE